MLDVYVGCFFLVLFLLATFRCNIFDLEQHTFSTISLAYKMQRKSEFCLSEQVQVLDCDSMAIECSCSGSLYALLTRVNISNQIVKLNV